MPPARRAWRSAGCVPRASRWRRMGCRRTSPIRSFGSCGPGPPLRSPCIGGPGRAAGAFGNRCAFPTPCLRPWRRRRGSPRASRPAGLHEEGDCRDNGYAGGHAEPARPVGPYTPVVRAGAVADLQRPARSEGRAASSMVASPARSPRPSPTFEALLAGEGADLNAVAKTTVFLADIADYPAMNDAYVAAFGDHRPAHSRSRWPPFRSALWSRSKPGPTSGRIRTWPTRPFADTPPAPPGPIGGRRTAVG